MSEPADAPFDDAPIDDEPPQERPAGESFQCAVCWDDTSAAGEARLPCCVIPAASSTRYCHSCIAVICASAPGNVGRCPNCRSYLRIGAGGAIEEADAVDTCTLCQQVRVIVETRGGGRLKLCGACSMGQRHTLRYECEQCRRFQRIPHPMYRYQPTPQQFGDVSWACHQRCRAQTHWRVHPEDVLAVPADDAPEGWGMREAWFDAVRQQRRREGRAARPRLDAQHQPIEAGREMRLLLIAAAFLAAAAFDLSTLPPWARWAGLAVAGVYSWRRVYVANGRVLNPPA